MAKNLPRALCTGSLNIGKTEISCAVLDNGVRLLSEREVTRALGGKRGGSHWRRKKADPSGAYLPVYISANNLKPFVNSNLKAALKEPYLYLPKTGNTQLEGMEATLLPKALDVLLKAREAGKLHPSQKHIAHSAEIIMRSLAGVGIVALIDEATGYQYDRKHDALRVLLQAYIEDELKQWVKTFPDSFFAALDRLYENEVTTPRGRPQYYGKFINKYVYDPIERGFVKRELDRRNITDSGKRKARFHQWLTDDGRSQLILRIGKIEGLMETSPNLRRFKENAKRLTQPSLFDILDPEEDNTST